MKKILNFILVCLMLFDFAFATTSDSDTETNITDNDNVITEEDVFYSEPLPDYNGDWVNFRSNNENMGITYAHTPRNTEEIEFKWAKKYSSSYKDSITPPIIVNDNLYIAGGDRVYIVDRFTGDEICVSEPLEGELGYALNPITYGGGMVFIPISKGRIQALRADTLESVWVSRELGGQSLSPVTYKDGYVFSATWTGENKEGKYYCIDVSDEDVYDCVEIKDPLWELSHTGGFYWAGAYAGDGYVIFGSDDGKKGYDNVGSVLYSLNIEDGSILDCITDIKGDIRSSVSYDISSSYIYFSSKCGDFHRVILNPDGSFDHSSHTFINVGNMTTSTPIVYNNLGFSGVCGESQFSDNGHSYAVIDVSGDVMQLICRENVPGYVQTSALLTVGYENDFKKIFLYLTYNREPGGIYVIEIKNPSDNISVKGYDLFLPSDDMQGYCVCSLVCDNEGNIYYKNDSGYLFCIGKSDTYEYFSEIAYIDVLKEEAIEEMNVYIEKMELYNKSEYIYSYVMEIYDKVCDAIYQADEEDKIEILVSDGINKISLYITETDSVKDNEQSEKNNVQEEIFCDIFDSKYKECIEYLYSIGVVNGVNEKEFMPLKKVTRAEVVEFLYRIADDKFSNCCNFFSDVKEEDWFYNSVLWAYESGIVKGVSEEKFLPYDYVTNEQVAVFVSRYISYMGYKFNEKDFNMRLYEYDDISSWAIGDVMYLAGYGIIPVYNGGIDAKEYSSRESVCNVLFNMVQIFSMER